MSPRGRPRSYGPHVHVALGWIKVSGECRAYPPGHDKCRTDGCRCRCHSYAWQK